MTMHTRYSECPPFTTKDGSTIRELMHPQHHHTSRHQSLAEARVAPGCTTLLHRHHQTEELYHITAGKGVMVLGDKRFGVNEADTVVIPPGTPHAIENCGEDELVILCCCSPPYSHEDTELL